MEVYESETKEIVRRFLARKLTFPQCIVALDSALSDLIPRLTAEDSTRLRIVMLANNEVVMKEMERRTRSRRAPMKYVPTMCPFPANSVRLGTPEDLEDTAG